jgi:hypothetical protein
MISQIAAGKICMDELMQQMTSENLDIAETAALG